MVDRRQIYVLLLNRYLEGLSSKGQDGEPDGPFWGSDIEVRLHLHMGAEDEVLVLMCKHFVADFPATPEGMLTARRAIDELAQLAQGNYLGIGDPLDFDEERGYFLEVEGERRYLLTDEGASDHGQ